MKKKTELIWHENIYTRTISLTFSIIFISHPEQTKIYKPTRNLYLTDPHIQPPYPNRMKNHMKHIKPFSRRVHLKVPPNLQHSSVHPQILSRRYRRQDRFQIWYVLHGNNNRKRWPIQHIAEGRNVTWVYQNRNTSRVKRLDDPRASNLVTTRTYAELTVPHRVRIRRSFR